MINQVCCLLSVLILFVVAKNEDYMGYKVYNIRIEKQEQLDRFFELKSDEVDFWRRPSLKHNVVGRAMVPQSHFNWFEEKLQELGISRSIHIEDVYEYLTETDKSFTRSFKNDTGRVFGFEAYYTFDEIIDHMKGLENVFTNSAIDITFEEFGSTEENRPIAYLKVAKSSTVDTEKPVVIIEAGINPREWITVPSALNIVNRLIENQEQFLDKADWIVIPVLNPDGYAYTHSNLRLWTKSRSTKSHLGYICPGVNLNRNFDVEWQVADSSSSPCSHLYAGIEPFSEPETQLIKSLIQEYGSRIKLYVSLQNNGGFVSYPWYYEKAASGMFRQHHLLGIKMMEAMNDEYYLDIGWSALGERASGTSSDFAQQNGVLYSLNIDVVQRGDDGVNIPEDEIVTVIEDVWKAIAVAAEDLL